MAEDDAVFDPSLKKKKKKKRTPFDLDAAMGGEPGAAEETETPAAEAAAADDQPAEQEEKIEDFILDDDFSNLTKKKKKKKKPFDMSDLDDVLPEKKSEEVVKEDSVTIEGMDDELDMDMALPSKKKKKKKLILDEELLLEENEKEEPGQKTGGHVPGHAWANSDRDYTYDELLKRVFDIMREKNPDMVAGERKKFNMKPPRVMRVGTKKSSFANFKEICKMLHRQPEHLLTFLLAELGTSGSIDGNDQLIIKGRFQQKQIENVLRSYIKEYVTCHTCKSRETMLQKDTRLYFLQCETCGSRCSVTSIKSGFQAVTGKRAAIRAKKA